MGFIAIGRHLLVLAIPLDSCSQYVLAESSSPREVLSEVKATREWVSQIQLHVRTKSEAVYGILDSNEIHRFDELISIRRFGDYADLASISRRVGVSPPQWASGGIHQLILTDAGELSMTQLEGRLQWTTLDTGATVRRGADLVMRTGLSFALEGFLPVAPDLYGRDGFDVVSLLASCEDLTVEAIDEQRLRISGQSSTGVLEVDVSQARPRRILRYVLTSQWNPGEKPIRAAEGLRVRPGETRDMRYIVEVDSWVDLNGTPVARSGSYRYETTTFDGRVTRMVQTFERSEITPLQDRGSTGSIDLPDGTPVAVVRDGRRHGVAHIVQGGRIVPVPPRELDPAALAAVPRQDVGGPSIGWLGGLGLAAAAVVVATGVLVQRRRRAGGTATP